jgi:multiple sugar transport system substrate-binding protein
METPHRIGRPTIALVVVVAAAVIVGMLVLSGGNDPAQEPTPTTPTPAADVESVEFGVWGNAAEVAAYRHAVDSYNETSEVVDATLVSWPDADSMLADIRSGAASPDLYLLPRADLAETIAAGRNRPLLDLLDARGVGLGDNYSRNAIAAFSSDDALQCMPYTISPMVMYYNTDLIDFGALAEQDQEVPREDGRWSLAAFRAAAEMATKPRQRTRGFYIEPTIEGLAPFIYSGGGQVFDDDVDPTSLALGEDESVEAMTRTLEVLRDSKLTPTADQLRRKSPVELFEDGRLGMIAGYRDLTPRLRKVEGLHFDVLPMPTLDTPATVGELNGLCIAEGPQPQVERAADFLVHVTSEESVGLLAEAGTVVPANLPVAFGPAFTQPGRQPQRSMVFTANQRYIRLWPLIESGPELEALAMPGLTTLATAPVLSPAEIDETLDQIDEDSRPILDPDYDPSSSDGSATESNESDSTDPASAGS